MKALEKTAQEAGYTAELLQAVENVNQRQKQVLVKKILNHYQGNIKGKILPYGDWLLNPKQTICVRLLAGF